MPTPEQLQTQYENLVASISARNPLRNDMTREEIDDIIQQLLYGSTREIIKFTDGSEKTEKQYMEQLKTALTKAGMTGSLLSADATRNALVSNILFATLDSLGYPVVQDENGLIRAQPLVPGSTSSSLDTLIGTIYSGYTRKDAEERAIPSGEDIQTQLLTRLESQNLPKWTATRDQIRNYANDMALYQVLTGQMPLEEAQANADGVLYGVLGWMVDQELGSEHVLNGEMIGEQGVPVPGQLSSFRSTLLATAWQDLRTTPTYPGEPALTRIQNAIKPFKQELGLWREDPFTYEERSALAAEEQRQKLLQRQQAVSEGQQEEFWGGLADELAKRGATDLAEQVRRGKDIPPALIPEVNKAAQLLQEGKEAEASEQLDFLAGTGGWPGYKEEPTHPSFPATGLEGMEVTLPTLEKEAKERAQATEGWAAQWEAIKKAALTGQPNPYETPTEKLARLQKQRQTKETERQQKLDLAYEQTLTGEITSEEWQAIVKQAQSEMQKQQQLITLPGEIQPEEEPLVPMTRRRRLYG